MGDMEGKTAVVTGGAGIGGASALALARAGARVAVVERDEAVGRACVADITDAGGSAALFGGDLGNRSDIARIAGDVLAAFGGVDALVNAAGIQRYGTVTETDEATWDEVMDVNVTAMFLMAKHLMPSLEARHGTIVNVGSVQSECARPGSVAYVTSKHAVLGLTRAMAVDHAPQVRVNCVAPGSVDTPMLRWSARQLSDDEDAALAEWGAMHPMGRIAAPAEIAELICFLAGPRSSFTTGACYLADGGWRATLK